MKKILITLILTIILTACSSQESEIKDLIRSKLKDPDSAKFGELIIYPAGSTAKNMRACMTVNSKNSMGGYTGEQIAVLWKGLSKDSEWRVLHIGTMSLGLCR